MGNNQNIPNLPSEIAFAFELFGRSIEIRWYAIFVTGGMLLALMLLILLMKRKKDEFVVDDALEIFLFAIPFAILFARLGFSLPRVKFPITSWDEFAYIFDITQGGLTIVTGILGGALGILIYCKIRKKSPFRVFDTLIPCLLLGQIVGRWGNFFNQELYGFQINEPAFQRFPFAVYIEHPYAAGMDLEAGWYCANFFYEGCLNTIALIVMLVLIFKAGDRLKVGTISVGYIVWYGLVRATLEFIKIGQLTVGGVRVIQLICFIAAAVGVVVLVLLQKGIIKLETDKMRKNHFITSSMLNETMSNNNNYEVTKRIVIVDEEIINEGKNHEE